MYRIRTAHTLDHFRHILLLDRICFDGDKAVDTSRGIFWLMWHQGEPIGYSSMRPSVRIIGRYVRERSCILPEHRGRGLQRRLIRASQRWVRAHNKTELVATTAAWNVESANNFIRCGFRLFYPNTRWMEKSHIYWIWKPGLTRPPSAT